MVRAQWQNEFIVNFATSIFFSSRTFLVFLYKLLLWDIVLSVCVCVRASDWYPRNRISRHNNIEPRRERVHESTNPKNNKYTIICIYFQWLLKNCSQTVCVWFSVSPKQEISFAFAFCLHIFLSFAPCSSLYFARTYHSFNCLPTSSEIV